VPHHEDIGVVEVQLHTFLTLALHGRWVVSFMPWLLYPQVNSPCCLLDRRLDGPQSWSGCSGRETEILVPARNQTLVIHPIA